MNKQVKLIFSGLGILSLAVLLMIQCTGLVKLKIPKQTAEEKENAWLIPYGNNFRHNSVKTDVLPPYEILWEKGYRSVIPDHALAVNQYLIFTVKNGMLAFVDIDKGNMLGDGRIAPGFNHAPLISDNILYYAANLGNETLGSFNLSSLKKNWEKKLPHLNTSPLFWNDKIFVGAENGKFYSFKAGSGEKLWQFDGLHSINGSAALYDGKIHFVNIRGMAFCINATTGKLIWKTQLKENIYAGPLIALEKVFIGSTSGIYYAIDIHTGKISWRTNTRGSIYGNAAYRDSTIYIGNNAHKMMAINATNGKIIWEFKSRGINNTAPLAGPDFLYFGSWDKNFYVLDRKSGDLIYREEFKKPIKTSPIIYQQKIIFNVSNHRVYCLASETKISESRGER